MFYLSTSFLKNLSFCTCHIFRFPSFCWFISILSVQLWHFHKLSINQILQSLKIIIWYKKIIIWYKYLLLFDRVFLELFGRNFYKVDLKLFFICLLEMVVGPFWKYSANTLQLLLGSPFKGRYLHITIDICVSFKGMELAHYTCYWAPFESKLLTHYNCCVGPLWKHSTCTLQFLLVAPLKARYSHITIVGGPVTAR